MKVRAYITVLLITTALLVFAWLCYAPGLHGGFLFDDYANLPKLASPGPVDNWPAFWRYITSGMADPTGRPLTLLSFLLDARNWPAMPAPFLRTNLALHLLNGLLLALLLNTLGQHLHPSAPTYHRLRQRIRLAGLLGAGLWLLHPLLVSTTLYIVQREAMLPGTFELLGLLAWLHGRRRLLNHQPGGLAWIIGGLGAGTVLAVLCKANGALLPLLALTLETTVLRAGDALVKPPDAKTSSHYRWAMRLLAVLPSLLLIAGLLYTYVPALTRSSLGNRPWTLGERLLTEPRVLLDYLKLLWLPRPFTPGLFNDQFPLSTALWRPWTTLPAIVGMLVWVGTGLALRRRLPAVALALLFYAAGQVLESTLVPLELYFEHRNYIPAMLLFWPLALWLCGVPQMPGTNAAKAGLDHRLKAVLAILLLAGLGSMTYLRASLWGNQAQQALTWAALNPRSPRAQVYAAQADLNSGHPQAAIRRLQPALAHQPDQIQLAFNLLAAECRAGHIPHRTEQAALYAMRHAHDAGSLITSWFGRAVAQSEHAPCPQLQLPLLQRLAAAGLENPRLATQPGRRQDLWHILGQIALMQGHATLALTDFNHALKQQPRYGIALQQAALLGSCGYPAQGLAHLNYLDSLHLENRHHGWNMASLHAWVLHHQHYWHHELTRLRANLRAAASSSAHGPAHA
ncbi:tetratricopeptide repeat protein [Oleiagrimonas sp. C23AA]|uniref:tetratricopeptide repeat protein n=1 Tax=Oleiagrimonas sp. C23AA TaxID=2719047 RepID=UPI00141E0A71|nr:tetratricopeptide repeat protein [Oleiagrimonas sp. C23AA]NII11444.1 tetratricopeptide repeat protein [Oleiagrimonas sp. C23AA]